MTTECLCGEQLDVSDVAAGATALIVCPECEEIVSYFAPAAPANHALRAQDVTALLPKEFG